jgi:hypothetical protein
MNEVTDICHRILDRPSPPMRDSTHVLATARRAARRQVRVTVAASSLVAAAILAVTAFAGMLHAAAARTPSPAVLLTTVAIPTLSQTPARERPRADGARIALLLADALPAGYHGRPASGAEGTLIVSTGDGHGTLSATVVRDGVGAPSGDLCSPAVATRLGAHLPDGDAACQVVTVDGVQVRASTTAGGGTVTRFVSGGFLILHWQRRTALFTLDQLAEVAATMRIPE